MNIDWNNKMYIGMYIGIAILSFLATKMLINLAAALYSTVRLAARAEAPRQGYHERRILIEKFLVEAKIIPTDEAKRLPFDDLVRLHNTVCALAKEKIAASTVRRKKKSPTVKLKACKIK